VLQRVSAEVAPKLTNKAYCEVYAKKHCLLLDRFPNSLLNPPKSLLPIVVSLIFSVGNLERSACGSGVSCVAILSFGPNSAKFPEKFPGVPPEIETRKIRDSSP
jgi:hypothetical protein